MRATQPLASRLPSGTLSTTTSPALLALHRRTRLAQRQIERKLGKQREVQRLASKREKQQQWVQAQAAKRGATQAERRARREDWEMGALAPRRTAGADGGVHGALPAVLASGMERRTPATFGTAEDYGIREGDRVVVVDARLRDAGRIGKVISVDTARHECSVERINMVSPLPEGDDGGLA